MADPISTGLVTAAITSAVAGAATEAGKETVQRLMGGHEEGDVCVKVPVPETKASVIVCAKGSALEASFDHPETGLPMRVTVHQHVKKSDVRELATGIANWLRPSARKQTVDSE